MLLNAGSGDFRTENLSLGMFIFLLFLGGEQAETLLSKPFVQRSGEGGERRNQVRMSIQKEVSSHKFI